MSDRLILLGIPCYLSLHSLSVLLELLLRTNRGLNVKQGVLFFLFLWSYVPFSHPSGGSFKEVEQLVLLAKKDKVTVGQIGIQKEEGDDEDEEERKKGGREGGVIYVREMELFITGKRYVNYEY